MAEYVEAMEGLSIGPMPGEEGTGEIGIEGSNQAEDPTILISRIEEDLARLKTSMLSQVK